MDGFENYECLSASYEGHLDIVQNRHEYGTEWFDN